MQGISGLRFSKLSPGGYQYRHPNKTTLALAGMLFANPATAAHLDDVRLNLPKQSWIVCETDGPGELVDHCYPVDKAALITRH